MNFGSWRAMAATSQALSSRVDDSARKMKKIWPQGPPSQTTESLTMFGQTMLEFVRINFAKYWIHQLRSISKSFFLVYGHDFQTHIIYIYTYYIYIYALLNIYHDWTRTYHNFECFDLAFCLSMGPPHLDSPFVGRLNHAVLLAVLAQISPGGSLCGDQSSPKKPTRTALPGNYLDVWSCAHFFLIHHSFAWSSIFVVFCDARDTR